MKRTILIVVILLMGLCACETPPELHSTIFPDVERIDNLNYSGGNFTYYAPEEVKYLVLGIFTDTIETDPDTMTITTTIRGGQRTGLGMTRSSVTSAELYEYSYGIKNFDIGSPYALPNPFHWAVWGYDEYGNLTHASSEEIDSP